MDVKTIFLNGEIEDIYIKKPKLFINHHKNSYVCKLKKELYGLKQALRAWKENIDNYL